MIFSSAVPHAFAGCTVLDYLARRFTYLTADGWQHQVSRGRIARNGLPCGAETRLTAGDLIAFMVDQAEFPEPPADLAFRLLYEDDWLLAVDKPGDLLVHRQGRSLTHNLLYQLRHVHQPAYPQAGLVHRLDRETSGLVLLARRPEFLARLHGLFARQAVHKTYLAVVHGRPPVARGVIERPIGRDPDSCISYRYSAAERALAPKAARTEYQVLDSRGDHSLLRLWPTTGRTHQLRVHLAHLGHPLVGDKLYGRTDEEFLRWRDRPFSVEPAANLGRQALHCEALRFLHPWTGRELALWAALPADLGDWQPPSLA